MPIGKMKANFIQVCERAESVDWWHEERTPI